MYAQRPGETELVQRGRPQPVHEAAQVGDDLGRRSARRGEVLERLLGVRGELGLHGVEVEPQAGEQRSEPVVQVAPEPAALLLSGLDQPPSGHEQTDATTTRHRVSRPQLVAQHRDHQCRDEDGGLEHPGCGAHDARDVGREQREEQQRQGGTRGAPPQLTAFDPVARRYRTTTPTPARSPSRMSSGTRTRAHCRPA